MYLGSKTLFMKHVHKDFSLKELAQIPESIAQPLTPHDM